MLPTTSRLLTSWSHQGAITSSKNAYNAVCRAVEAYDWPPDIQYDIYLQGSYRNDTNIRDSSDVDVVVQLKNHYIYDEAYGLFFRLTFHGNALHTWQNFKSHVENAMRYHFGWNKVTSGNKSIKVETPYFTTDVVPCMQYRKLANGSGEYVEGMTFYAVKENRWIVNFPKHHYYNGVYKNQSTQERYKSTIRVFKNAKSYMEKIELTPSGLAPSYFVECMLYNVPNHFFVYDLRDRWTAILVWLCQQANLDIFQCQNGQSMLFGSGLEHWSVPHAQKFISNLTTL